MLRGAGVDEVELEVVRGRVGGAGVGASGGTREIPPVDVVVAEVLDGGERGGEALQVRGGCAEGGAFGDEEGGLGGDLAKEDYTAALGV